MRRLPVYIAFAVMSLLVSLSPTAQTNSVRSDRLGITFISSAELPPNDTRYNQARALGAGWNRFPMYWWLVERAPGQFDWAGYDRVVADDVRFGINTNAILLGRPDFYAQGAVMQGLNQPVFADGSDVRGAGKAINPNNKWAVYVWAAVNRYKPGGDLARARGWGGNTGVRVWEVWNEPDLPQFWQGSIAEYARLLKVAYLAAHTADANATVMMGGLLYNTPTNWLSEVLKIYQNDPQAPANRYYMDAVAVHSYHYPWRTGWLTLVTRQRLNAYGLNIPIFLNETGLSVWNDYPGPVWGGSERIKRGTMEQQAWFFIQSTAYGWAEGADVVFYHQLYDDCGDQPAGTNFPPHNGELCGGPGLCYGDGWGLYRNTGTEACFTQHPNPGTPRPSAQAFRLMAEVFGAAPFVGGTVTRQNGYTMITFRRPNSNELIRVVWNRRFEANTARITANNDSATLYTLNGTRSIFQQGGGYNLDLRPAIPDNYPDLEPGDISAVGGEPVILVELQTGDVDIAQGDNPAPSTNSNPLPNQGLPGVRPTQVTPIASSEQLFPTPGAVLVVPEQPTVMPENDTQPPQTRMGELPLVSPQTFNVTWQGIDDGAIDRYIVWVRTNDGDWTPWLETERTDGLFTGVSGTTYFFAVWAVDKGGNWSTNTELVAQATTRVE